MHTLVHNATRVWNLKLFCDLSHHHLSSLSNSHHFLTVSLPHNNLRTTHCIKSRWLWVTKDIGQIKSHIEFPPPTKPAIDWEKHTLVIGVPCFPGKWSKTSFSHRSKRHCEIFIALFGTQAETTSVKRKTYVPVHDTVNCHVTGKATDAAATGIMNRNKSTGTDTMDILPNSHCSQRNGFKVHLWNLHTIFIGFRAAFLTYNEITMTSTGIARHRFLHLTIVCYYYKA